MLVNMSEQAIQIQMDKSYDNLMKAIKDAKRAALVYQVFESEKEFANAGGEVISDFSAYAEKIKYEASKAE